MLTRRKLIECLGAAGMLRVNGSGATSPLERVASEHRGRTTATHDRRYRADATVSFLGITIFSREGVGAGTVRVEKGETAEGTSTVALRFTAGSTPERARGLNRLGYIQELVVERDAKPVESAYFGFITSSPEKSLDQAKGALGPAGKDAVPYAAVEGGASQKVSSYTLYNTLLPSAYTYVQCESVVARVRQSLAKDEIKPSRSETVQSASPQTFLYAVRQAIGSADARMSAPFLYNGKQYRLDAEKSQDVKAGQQFAQRKLPVRADRVSKLTGSIHNVATRENTSFRLWFQLGQDLPIRFEYKPRSFLNLAFEWVQG
jgi:hypothetical protein